MASNSVLIAQTRAVERRRDRFVIPTLAYGIVLLAYVVRLYHLGTMGLEFDEAFSVESAFRSFPDLIHLLTHAEPHPPLYYSFLHLWYPLAGTTEFALRFPTLVANVLTVALLIRVAAYLGWRAGGLVGALMLAINPYQVWYAQEARMYTPVALFGLAAVYFALRALRGGARRDLVWHALFMLLALATHYYALFLWGFLGLFVGAAILARRPSFALGFGRWCLTQAAVAVVYLPWLAYAYRISIYYVRADPRKVDLFGVVKESLEYYSLGRSMPVAQLTTLSLGFLAVVAVGLFAAGRAGRLPGWLRLVFLGGYLLTPLVAGYVVSMIRSMYTPNYMMVSAPAFYLALGLGVVELFRLRWPFRLPLGWPLAAAAGLFLTGAQLVSLHNYFFDPHYNKAEVANAFRYVDAHLRPGDVFILDGLGQRDQFWYYNTVRVHDPAPAIWYPPLWPATWASLPSSLDPFLASRRGAWLLDYGVDSGDRGRVVENYLARHYYQAFYRPIIFNRVVYYAAAPATPAHQTTVEATCDDTLLLRDVATYADAKPAGDIIPLAARWQALGVPRQPYEVSWRLLDAAGHVVLQRDSPPASGFAPTTSWSKGETVVDRYGLLLPAWLPPGTYTPEIVVYNQATGAGCQFVRGGKKLADPAIVFPNVAVSDAPPLPPLANPAPRHPANVAVEGLRFLGFDLDPGPYQPGQTLSPHLFWHVNGTPPADATIQARLIDAAGAVVQQETSKLGMAGFPSSRWQAGRDVAGYVDLSLPPRLTTGAYRLSLIVSGPGFHQELLAGGPTVSVVARDRNFQPPRVAFARPADFGGKVGLLGYDLQPAPTATLAPGQAVHLTLYWKSEGVLNDSYKVFTHLVGPDGKIYGQQDGIPLQGRAPTNGWVPGEFLTDRYALSVAAGAPTGTYTIQVGFYNPATGARLSLADHSADSVVVARVRLLKKTS